jgi:hypothetical protein
MNEYLRIPFGQREVDGAIVDVHDAPNGRACGCICPSCKTPLIARQGTEREWHFAHASKSVYAATSDKCEFSVYVAAAMMGKQLFVERPAVHLPAYEITLRGTGAVTGKQHSVSVRVTTESVVTLDSCQVEADVGGLRIDIHSTVKDRPLAFYLIHPERRLPVSQSDFQGSRFGALSIDLSCVPDLFRDAMGVQGGYKAALGRFLFDGCIGKRWIYHPRQAEIIKKASEELERLCQEKRCTEVVRRPQLQFDVIKNPSIVDTPEEQYQVRYECVYCHGEKWIGPIRGGNICPKCGQYLYTRELGRIT